MYPCCRERGTLDLSHSYLIHAFAHFPIQRELPIRLSFSTKHAIQPTIDRADAPPPICLQPRTQGLALRVKFPLIMKTRKFRCHVTLIQALAFRSYLTGVAQTVGPRP